MSNIAELNPTPLWKHFAKLCEIPRPSKHEDRVVEYIVDFAKHRGLEVQLDEIGNVISRSRPHPAWKTARHWPCKAT